MKFTGNPGHGSRFIENTAVAKLVGVLVWWRIVCVRVRVRARARVCVCVCVCVCAHKCIFCTCVCVSDMQSCVNFFTFIRSTTS